MARELYTRTDIDSYEYRTTLDGVDFILGLAWSIRGDQWILTLKDTDGNFLESTPLLLYRPLFSRYQRDDLPAGEITLVDSEGKNTPCGREDLGSRCKLVYLEVQG